MMIGAPQRGFGQGNGMPPPQGVPDFQMNLPNATLPTPTAGSGKPKTNFMGILADALSGAVGMPTQYSASLHEQHTMKMQEDAYSARQMAEFDRQRQMYDYQIAHPNDQISQRIRQMGIDPNSTHGQSLLAMAFQNETNPLAAFDYKDGNGNTTKQFMRGPTPTFLSDMINQGQPQASAPAAWADSPTPPQGGQTPPASGVFPLAPRRRR